MELTGQSIIGYGRGRKGGKILNGFNPATGEILPPAFYSASDDEVEAALELAAEGFTRFSASSGRERAAFLRAIAENLERLGDTLVDRAVSESGLPAGRIRSERARTCSQLRFFAEIAETASWADARIDHADPARLPVPKPDVRSMLRPLGPVAVFCAGNFPLAFSVAGGDTASAFASGNTVAVMAHYAHPGTAELAGTAIRDAAYQQGLPGGVFSLLYDSGHEVAQALVRHPEVKAVGFTGSRSGGMALLEVANSRPEPIPFYGEMSSINPVFVLPSALASRPAAIARDLHASATLGVGQFCTNPGVVVTLGPPDTTRRLVSQFVELMSATAPGIMLNRNIAASYHRAISERSRQRNIHVRWSAGSEVRSTECSAGTSVFETDAQGWLTDSDLQDEIFGPATLVVKAERRDELLEVARSLYGNLTASILGDARDLTAFSDLVAILEKKVGRVLFNSLPTGVEVCQAMVHGGPYPATSDGRSTSVGGRAILRFTRPVCYQDFPDEALPPELQDGNPLGVARIEDGQYVRLSPRASQNRMQR
ncbi:MAG: aldehyde dehydrogenase (NADP(+)) [Candidatus Acidiferrum sp.]|jgi:alpha-ketoglutaric semialdehyde dehydrogenase